MSLAENLKSARKKKGMTMMELSEIIGCSKQLISKYETGVITNMPIERLQAIAYALDVDPLELAGMKDDEKETENDKLRFALYGGAEGITDEMLEEVRNFANYIKEREKNK